MAPKNTDNTRVVYSSSQGRVLPERRRAQDVPAGDGVVRVSRTKAGRRGKTVTLVTGLPPGELAGVAAELKRLCGAGGAVKEGAVELQGDHRERVAERLGQRYRVKLSGG